MRGTTAGDQIGYIPNYTAITALPNGNYLVASPSWDNGGIADAGAVEKLADIEVPERAEYIRVITCELNRISSHLLCVITSYSIHYTKLYDSG